MPNHPTLGPMSNKLKTGSELFSAADGDSGSSSQITAELFLFLNSVLSSFVMWKHHVTDLQSNEDEKSNRENTAEVLQHAYPSPTV